MFASYTANTSSVDGKSAFLDEPAQHDHVNYFQSFKRFQEKGLPTSLPAEKMAEMQHDARYVELQKEIEQLQHTKAAKGKITAAQNKLRSYRDSLSKVTLQRYQVEWVQKRRDWKVATRGKQRSEAHQQTDLLRILGQIKPERNRLARMMILDDVFSEQQRQQVIADLCSLASWDCTTIYLPGEAPINDVCPGLGCGRRMRR